MRGCFFFLLFLLKGQLYAAEIESLERIRAAAVAVFMPAENSGAAVDITLDKELRLPLCGQDLQAHATTRNVAEISCLGPSAWRLYVPVRIMRPHPVLVLTRTVEAGQPFTSDMVVSTVRNLNEITGSVLSDQGALNGRAAARTLVAGAVLSPGDLVAERIIRRGDPIVLVARRGNIEVRAAGKALGDAGLSERIMVENIHSRRTMQGIVQAPGEVEISL